MNDIDRTEAIESAQGMNRSLPSFMYRGAHVDETWPADALLGLCKELIARHGKAEERHREAVRMLR